MKNPFAHKHEEASNQAAAEHRRTHHGWAQREGDGIAQGSSSLFFHSHEDHLPPSRTCIQGHDIAPGQDTCSHGHPAG
ncbi:hypothetical protein GCM10027449_16840 [Sinomonas notoginsengisoli]|uniref:hypothetical protein n=1 Tax=Sinomonas notoginsengisoli TaxID=1457311 RepID=UPI001F2BE59F|nr:hypothetical protein [Sinomonas notoginsengisoli]